MGFSPDQGKFLPVNRADMDGRGWDCCDFVFVSGDAYVDHPSFAAALICRVLEAAGYRAGIIAQPDWKDPAAYRVLGRPRLAFLAGAGNLDSMVAHYTSAKKPRSEDAYSPGGRAGLRPDRALLKYVEGIRAAWDDAPVIIGGIEASLRRFAHYDYWSDKVRRSALLDSKADILVYGMGEGPLLEIARRLAAGEAVSAIRDVRGTCVRGRGEPGGDHVRLPDYEAVRGADPGSLRLYAEHFMLQKQNADPATGRVLAEKNDGDRWVLQNPPAFPLSQADFDRIYELPYLRRAHPMYDGAGGVPALKETAFSLVSSRGCFGGCSFCAITFHQGRAVRGRSRESLVREAAALTAHPDFKGYIHDVGGPTANFYQPPCERQRRGGFCPDRECLWPAPCPHLKADHGPYLETLRALESFLCGEFRGVAEDPKGAEGPERGGRHGRGGRRLLRHGKGRPPLDALPDPPCRRGVKKIFIRSGLRFDFIGLDRERGGEFLETLCRRHVSGQLKVAPEHVAAGPLAAMGKGTGALYEGFRREFEGLNRRLGLRQYLIPYFISSHPGSTLEDAVELALYLKRSGFAPDQAQDFYPTPGTLSTAMYHTGLDPRTMEPVYVPRGDRERRLQRSLLHFNRPENRAVVLEALREIRREDLAGALFGGGRGIPGPGGGRGKKKP